MSVLPSSVNYGEQISALPEGTQALTQVLSAVNGSTFAPNSIIQFDFLNRGFIDPESIYLSFSYTLTSAVSAEMVGTPFYTPFLRSEVLVGSVVIESINDYGVVCNILSNTTMSVAQKYGMQSSWGYNNDTAVPTLETMDGRLMTLNETGSFSGPLPNILTSADKLIPAFAMPQIRLQLTLNSLANMFTTTVVPTNFVLSNVELCYKMLDIPSAQAYTMSLDKFYIKSNGFVNSSVTLASGTNGSSSLVYNQRLASVKSAIISFGGTDANSLNKSFDSYAPSTSSTYQIQIAGQYYPQRPLSLVANKSRVLMELKNAIGSIYSASNALSINGVEFNRVVNTATTYSAPAKHYIGISLESLHSGLLTGTSTQNSPISLLFSTASATAQALNAMLILNYDALIEISPQEKQVSVKQ